MLYGGSLKFTYSSPREKRRWEFPTACIHPRIVDFPVLFSPTRNVSGRIRTICSPAKQRTSFKRNSAICMASDLGAVRSGCGHVDRPMLRFVLVGGDRPMLCRRRITPRRVVNERLDGLGSPFRPARHGPIGPCGPQRKRFGFQRRKVRVPGRASDVETGPGPVRYLARVRARPGPALSST